MNRDNWIRLGLFVIFAAIVIFAVKSCSSEPIGYVGNGFWIVCFFACVGAAVHSAHHDRTETSLVFCGLVGFILLVLFGAFERLPFWVIFLPLLAGAAIFGCTKFNDHTRTLLAIFAGVVLIIEAYLIVDGITSFSFSWASLSFNDKCLALSLILFATGVAWRLISARAIHVIPPGQTQPLATHVVILKNGSRWLFWVSGVLFLCGIASWFPNLNRELRQVPLAGGILDFIKENAAIVGDAWNNSSPMVKKIVAFALLTMAAFTFFGKFISNGVTILIRLLVFCMVVALAAVLVIIALHNARQSHGTAAIPQRQYSVPASTTRPAPPSSTQRRVATQPPRVVIPFSPRGNLPDGRHTVRY